MLFSQDGVDCLHKVFSALRRAEKGRQFVTSLDSRLDFISSGQAVICSVIEPPLAEILTCSTSEMSFLVFLLTQILCGQSHTQQSPRHLREKSSLMSHIRRNLVIYCEIIISRTEARTSVLLKFVIYYTCIGHRPDLKGISWDHVTESEGIFFFRRYRDPVGTSLQSSKEFFCFVFTDEKWSTGKASQQCVCDWGLVLLMESCFCENLPFSSSAWTPPCKQRPLLFWTLESIGGKKDLVITGVQVTCQINICNFEVNNRSVH